MILEFEETHQAIVTLDVCSKLATLKIEWFYGLPITYDFVAKCMGSHWLAAKWLWDRLYSGVPEDEDENSDIQYLYEILSDAMEKSR